ncbi:hypothetical protein Fmac_014049 [Flemingia macrophylla]|uniref:Uncharacterized protein n=1 Tax=Flemingia macrophylla TaxID=520843 RepID=A0ABD1MAP0_9FABA
MPEEEDLLPDAPASKARYVDMGFRGDSGGNRNRATATGGNGDERMRISAYYEEMLKSNPTDVLLLRNYGEFLHEIRATEQPKLPEVLVTEKGNVESGDEQGSDQNQAEPFEKGPDVEMSVLELVRKILLEKGIVVVVGFLAQEAGEKLVGLQNVVGFSVEGWSSEVSMRRERVLAFKKADFLCMERFLLKEGLEVQRRTSQLGEGERWRGWGWG